MVAALFLGNCYSCPQVLMALAEHHAPHSCCHHHQPVQTGCQTQTLQHFVKTDAGTLAPSLAVTAMHAPSAAAFVMPAALLSVRPAPTPPDLLALNASFRI